MKQPENSLQYVLTLFCQQVPKIYNLHQSNKELQAVLPCGKVRMKIAKLGLFQDALFAGDLVDSNQRQEIYCA